VHTTPTEWQNHASISNPRRRCDEKWNFNCTMQVIRNMVPIITCNPKPLEIPQILTKSDQTKSDDKTQFPVAPVRHRRNVKPCLPVATELLRSAKIARTFKFVSLKWQCYIIYWFALYTCTDMADESNSCERLCRSTHYFLSNNLTFAHVDREAFLSSNQQVHKVINK
jgi:hypothetical protein